MDLERLSEIERDLEQRLFKHGGYSEVLELIEFVRKLLMDKNTAIHNPQAEQ